MQIAITTLIAVLLALLGAFWLPDPGTRTQGVVLMGAALALAVYSFVRVEGAWPRPEPAPGANRQRSRRQRQAGIVLLALGGAILVWALIDIWTTVFLWNQAVRWLAGLMAGLAGAYLWGGIQTQNGSLGDGSAESSEPRESPTSATSILYAQGPGPRPEGYKLQAIGLTDPHPEDLTPAVSLAPPAAGATVPTAAPVSTAIWEPNISRWLEALVVLAILLLAVWFRAYKIEQMPPGIFVDETNAALDGLRILEGRPDSLFGTGWFEIPNAYVFLQAFMFRLLGATYFAIKLQSILPGVLTVLALYLLAKELFGTRPALFAAAFLAFNRWHFHMSRWGWIEVYPPLMQVLSLYFIQRAARLRTWGDWAMAGFLLGLGMYTYLAIRMAVIGIALYLGYRALVERDFLRRQWQGLLVFTVFYALTFAPLGFTYYKNPFTFLNRTQQVSILHDVESAGGDLQPLVLAVSRHLQMFNIEGDRNPRHNLPGAPMLDPITGGFFLLGLAWALWRWRDHKHGLLWIWVGATLLGGMLSRLNESPQAFRTLAAAPAVAILAADAYDLSLRGLIFAARRYHLWRWLWAFLAIAGLVAAGLLNYNTYFNKQMEDASVYASFSPLETEVAREVLAKRDDHKLFLSPRLYYFSPLRYLTYQPAEPYGVDLGPIHYSPFNQLGGGLDQPAYQLADPALDLPLPDLGGDNALFLLDLHFQYVLDLFSYYYPGVQAEVAKDKLGRPMYLSVTIPGEEISALQARNAGGELDRLRGLYIPSSGEYTLSAPSARTVTQIILDGEPLPRGPVFLGKGLHSVALADPPESLPADEPVISWTGPAGEGPVPDQYLFTKPPSGAGLLGSYYRGSDWQPPAFMQRLDPLLLTSWPDAEPIFGPFSATWTGDLLAPSDGPYQFQLHADDGVRVWLDGEVQAESLTPDTVNLASFALELTAGPHPIRIDYFQRGGGKALEFFWQPPGQPLQPVAPNYLRPPAK